MAARSMSNAYAKPGNLSEVANADSAHGDDNSGPDEGHNNERQKFAIFTQTQ